MAEFDLESAIKKGVETAINKPVYGGKSITEWAAIGMKAPQWISVKDRKPEIGTGCIVYSPNNFCPCGMTTALYTGVNEHEWITAAYCPGITHWMPLPKLPEVVQL